MKKLVFLAVLFLTTWISACSDDDDNSTLQPTLSFSQSVYSLTANTPLTVEITSSVAVTESTVVGFTLSGTAAEGKDYTISAREFTIPVGGKSAQLTITPQNNYTGDLEIQLELKPVAGFNFGVNKVAKVSVEPKEKLIYSFVQEYYVLASEVVIGVELKKEDGSFYIATEDVHLPFEVAEASTAVQGTHFTVENNVTEFIVPKGKGNTTLKLKYLDQKAGKDIIVLRINAGERFMAGNYDEVKVKVYGPTTVGKLFGKWAFDHTNSFETLKAQYEGMFSASDFTNMPVNNSFVDTLEFVAGEKNLLKSHVKGDLKNYLRDCEITYLRDTTMRTGSATYTVYSRMLMDKANVNFSVATVKERAAEIAFRILEDEKTLEVTVYDYEPADFFQEMFAFIREYPEDYWLMWDAKIQYYFTLVEE